MNDNLRGVCVAADVRHQLVLHRLQGVDFLAHTHERRRARELLGCAHHG